MTGRNAPAPDSRGKAAAESGEEYTTWTIGGGNVIDDAVTFRLTDSGLCFLREVVATCAPNFYKKGTADWRERLFMLSNTTLSAARCGHALYRIGLIENLGQGSFRLRRTQMLDSRSMLDMSEVEFTESIAVTLSRGIDASVLDAWLTGGDGSELIRAALLAVDGYSGGNRRLQ